jgi:hypothetical protein
MCHTVEQVQLTASARDSDGSVTSVQYFANGSSIGTSFNAGTNPQVNWTPTQSGIFNVYAVATDSSVNGVTEHHGVGAGAYHGAAQQSDHR